MRTTNKGFTLRSEASEGFTLIELLVSISIIGILIGLSIFGLQNARESSRDVKRRTDIEFVRAGLEIYKSDCGDYPTTTPVPGSSLYGDGSPTTCATPPSTYISAVPKDPLDPVRNYYYSRPSTTSYVICAALEQVPIPTPDTTGCASCGSAGACNYKVTNP